MLICAEGKLRMTTCLVLAAVVILAGILLYIDLLAIPSRADVRVVCACAVPGCRYHVAARQTRGWLYQKRHLPPDSWSWHHWHGLVFVSKQAVCSHVNILFIWQQKWWIELFTSKKPFRSSKDYNASEQGICAVCSEYEVHPELHNLGFSAHEGVKDHLDLSSILLLSPVVAKHVNKTAAVTLWG